MTRDHEAPLAALAPARTDNHFYRVARTSVAEFSALVGVSG
jgi:hypothetical protein